MSTACVRSADRRRRALVGVQQRQKRCQLLPLALAQAIAGAQIVQALGRGRSAAMLGEERGVALLHLAHALGHVAVDLIGQDRLDDR